MTKQNKITKAGQQPAFFIVTPSRGLARHLLLLVLFCGFYRAFADGPKPWRVKLLVETNTGKKFTGYMVVSEAYCSIDSLTRTASTPVILRQIKYQQNGDTLFFSRNLVLYPITLSYTDNNNKPIQGTANTYLGNSKILAGSIKTLRVLGVSRQSPYYIENKLTQSDTAWMNTRPLKFVWLQAQDWEVPWCDIGLFFHEQNAELDKLVARVKKMLKMESHTVADEKTLRLLLNKITRYKVVIAKMCTC